MYTIQAATYTKPTGRSFSAIRLPMRRYQADSQEQAIWSYYQEFKPFIDSFHITYDQLVVTHDAIPAHISDF